MELNADLLNEPPEDYGNNDFTDLQCWQKARDLRITISKLTRTFPVEEKFRLADQMIRASRSVTNNIAEGFGRFHYKESIRFYFISRGSISELKDHLLVALDEQYISQARYDEFNNLRTDAAKWLNGYIRYVISLVRQQLK